MNKAIRERIIEYLKNKEEIPAEYQDELFPTTKKEYELKYAGKERKEVILNDTMSVPFQAIKHFGKVKENEWANMLIFGDNLQSLKHLLKLKEEGKLKNQDGTDGLRLVYIDPPFGTGDAYDAKGDLPAYSAKMQGVKFIEHLRKRLILLKELLSDDGSIYVRLDYHFGHYIKLILDEIFGKENFLNELNINRITKKGFGANRFPTATDSLYFYKVSKRFRFNKIMKKLEVAKPDRWHSMDSMSPKGTGKPRMIMGRLMSPPTGRAWTFSQDKIDEMTKEGKIKLNSKGNPIYLIKSSDEDFLDSNWTDIPGYSAGSSSITKYPTENSEVLLDRIIRCSSNPGDIVLDCFAGSGTTGVVAEKLGRKWIMTDCGKLAIYTITKRMLNLKEEVGNKGKSLKAKPFVLYNAGLYYDGKMLEQMKGEEYKNFVLELFGCQKRDHQINGVNFHGTLNNHSVMIFDKKNDLTEEFVKDELHKVVGKDVKDELYIIAPVGVVGFNQDYIIHGNVKYTILRIPNSIIDYIREKNFTKLEQPRTAEDVNQTIDAVGFDFIYPPKVNVKYFVNKPKGRLIDKEYVIEINEFEPIQLGSKIVEFKDSKSESLAMVMIDLDYDGKTFQMDKYYFGEDIKKNDFKVKFDDEIGDKLMVIYLDIFGNEKREVIKKDKFKK